MVRINLVPGEKRTRTRMPSMPSLPTSGFDWVPRSAETLIGLAAFVLLLGAAYLYYHERSGLAEARAEIDVAVTDSTRFASQLERVRSLETSESALHERMTLLEEVARGRYFWIQLMEELAEDLPEYTWLEKVDQEDLPPDQIRISGASFSNAAVTDYMRGLEASPTLENVTLIGVTRVQRDEINVQGFTLVADFEGYQPVTIAPPDSLKEQKK